MAKRSSPHTSCRTLISTATRWRTCLGSTTNGSLRHGWHGCGTTAWRGHSPSFSQLPPSFRSSFGSGDTARGQTCGRSPPERHSSYRSSPSDRRYFPISFSSSCLNCSPTITVMEKIAARGKRYISPFCRSSSLYGRTSTLSFSLGLCSLAFSSLPTRWWRRGARKKYHGMASRSHPQCWPRAL